MFANSKFIMNSKKYILFSLSFILLLSSCQSVVRFTNNVYRSNNSNNSNTYNTNEHNSNNIKKNDYSTRTLNSKQAELINSAEKWIGTPYQYGGTGSNSIDCSAFVQNVFSSIGVTLPRTAQQQYNYLQRISEDELQPGDLVFFGKNGAITHVGIYIGNGYMIHASSSSGVIKQNLVTYSGYQSIAGFGRPKL
jgi:cell wall-associated NlpC family hydrolase